MARARHHDPVDLDQVLATLPAGFTVRPVGAARFVLGPTGAHVVALDNGAPHAPDTLAHIANLVRDALAQQVTWVPFVHAMLITERTDPCPPATRVPPVLMPGALVDGPRTLDDHARLRLVEAVASGVLDRIPTMPAGSQPLSA